MGKKEMGKKRSGEKRIKVEMETSRKRNR